jgi:pyruvate formate lyase activating enzyme
MGEGEKGACKVRGASGGEVRLLTYGMVTTAIAGQVEQKPFYHYEPGMRILSIGGMGCNMQCGFCQNFEISQATTPSFEKMEPKQVVELAVKHGSKGIAFTYNEPIVWFEYVMDVCKEAKKASLKTLLKTNGYADGAKFSELADQMSAINIDMKGDASEYERTCLVHGSAEDLVLKNISTACQSSHCEVSLILTPPVSLPRTRSLLVKARSFCDRMTALHLLRFIPDFKMKDVPATPVKDMEDVLSMSREFFDYPYLHGVATQNTECLHCGAVVVERSGEKCVNTRLGAAYDEFDGFYSCPSCRSQLPVRSSKDEV